MNPVNNEQVNSAFLLATKSDFVNITVKNVGIWTGSNV